ncbi:unnamed protein product, partial [Ectocarpus sp. 4 AP-2014]
SRYAHSYKKYASITIKAKRPCKSSENYYNHRPPPRGQHKKRRQLKAHGPVIRVCPLLPSAEMQLDRGTCERRRYCEYGKQKSTADTPKTAGSLVVQNTSYFSSTTTLFWWGYEPV